MALRSISLFAGVGGLDLGVELASGSRVVCYVEREAFAASILAARMRDGALARAPIWSDVETFDARRWRGCVDLVTGGFPCQDISVAGRGEGLEGDRSGLWREQLRVYRDSGARWLFVENVSALVIRGLDRVLADLAALGCDAEWTTLRAADVGAPHRRERLFLLARRVSDPERDPVRLEPERSRVGACEAQQRHAEPRDMGARDVANGDSERFGVERLAGGADEQGALGHDAHRCDAPVADASARGLRRGWASRGARQPACAVEDVGGADGPQWRPVDASRDAQRPDVIPPRDESAGVAREPSACPPGPAADWSGIEHHLHPAIEPGFCVVADGAPLVVDAARAGQLRALGNGVVPLQAAVAFRELWGRLIA